MEQIPPKRRRNRVNRNVHSEITRVENRSGGTTTPHGPPGPLCGVLGGVESVLAHRCEEVLECRDIEASIHRRKHRFIQRLLRISLVITK